ncbi:spore germination protein [Clostridium magnum]|uniref:Spore germination protein B1 n=1 Tax=Clostridium magnum DSM 2767 TaxID=1121326 RepID=A0A161W1P1_9CLOT|nr:spore germination protein [Clostridium magnum]KZL89090.1 spore germination protein B1 [Clostridium magnum DSM 2767]SHI29387.1 spore germination protein KA [Clostridium magnum DSM 2767]
MNSNNYLGYSLTKSLQLNIDMFKEMFSNDDTVVFREIESKQDADLKCCVIFIKGMANKDIIDEHIIQPIIDINLKDLKQSGAANQDNNIDIIIKKVLLSSSVKKQTKIDDLILPLLYGDTILLIEGSLEVILVETKALPERGIEEPDSERVVKGSKEGFNEMMITNLALIRKRLRTYNLKFSFKEVGTITKTKLSVCYIDGIVNEKILQELMKRLDNIDTDGIITSEAVDEFIKDAPRSLFKTIGNTERPDVAVGKLLEGRIVIVVDGTPFVLTLPFIFMEYYQSAEDYTNNYIFASLNRILRMMAFFLGVSIPALYVAVTTYHQELIPTALLLSISTAREGIPFPTVVEALIMLMGFTTLREAGVRLPQAIGQSLSIVGALVLGEAAVNARIISAPMVIVIAMTGISSFLVPKLIAGFEIVRLIFLLLSSYWGLFGYMYGVIGLFIYLFSLRSFGVPYMLYSSAVTSEDIKDTTLRLPVWAMKNRPRLISKNKKRQS